VEGILKYLKQNGERLDSEIAAAVGMPIASVRRAVSTLSAKGDVIVCRSIRYKNGKEVEGILCRVSGYTPPPAPGRKPKAQVESK
jgi:hypothetical protein